MRERVIVLKLGGSVLRDESTSARGARDLPLAPRGALVVAVVSALAGETDRLFGRAREAARTLALHRGSAAAAARAAALLAAASTAAGVRRASSPRGAAPPGRGAAARRDSAALDREARPLLVARRVAIVPGSQARTRTGEPCSSDAADRT